MCGVALESAKWIVLENEEQRQILDMLINESSIEMVLEKFEDFQDDVINVLTQLEAKQIENSESKSVFSNTRLAIYA